MRSLLRVVALITLSLGGTCANPAKAKRNEIEERIATMTRRELAVLLHKITKPLGVVHDDKEKYDDVDDAELERLRKEARSSEMARHQVRMDLLDEKIRKRKNGEAAAAAALKGEMHDEL